MAKSKKPNITVKTHPNGYELTIGTDGYFYHSLDDLLAGFIVRVGLNCRDVLDVEELHLIVLGIASQPNAKTLLNEQRQLMKAENKTERKPRDYAAENLQKKKKNIAKAVQKKKSKSTVVHPDVLESTKDILKISIDNTTLSNRAKNIICKAIEKTTKRQPSTKSITLGDVERLTCEVLKNVKGCGGASFYEILEMLHTYHITLQDEEE